MAVKDIKRKFKDKIQRVKCLITDGSWVFELDTDLAVIKSLVPTPVDHKAHENLSPIW